MDKNFKNTEGFQKLYIDYVLSSKNIEKIKHITDTIVYVYSDNWIYIFNFAIDGKKYIKTSCLEKKD